MDLLLHAWIILVIVKQHLVQIGRIDGPRLDLGEGLGGAEPVGRLEVLPPSLPRRVRPRRQRLRDRELLTTYWSESTSSS